MDTDTSFAQSFDAMDWARAFVQHVEANPAIPTDVGTMLAWFAGAIMRGFDEANRRRDAALLETPKGLEISAENWLRQAAGRVEQSGFELDADILIRDLLHNLRAARSALPVPREGQDKDAPR